MHPNVHAVQTAITAAGASGQVRTLSDAVNTAEAAATALGVEVGQIVKSLIFEADGEPLLVLTSGAHQVDTAKVAALVGATRMTRATPQFVRTHTGQAIGGVAPVGHPAPVRTLIDQNLAQYDEVWAAGGIPHAVFPATFAELTKMTGGTVAEVA